MRMLCICAAAALVGCASTGIIPTDRGAYIVTKTNGGGMFVNPEVVKADLYVEAGEHCAKSSQVVETIKTTTTSSIPFVRLGGASLEFRCVAR